MTSVNIVDDAEKSDGKRLVIGAPSDREISMTRTFDAPRRLVFDAMTQPELLKRWFGPRAWKLTVCEIDLRVGGAWRYQMEKNTGAKMTMSGVYREIVRGERFVTTEKFDDPWYEGEALVTTTFSETNGRTTMVVLVRYDTKAIRDAVLATPMESGVAEGYDQLDELVTSIMSS